jgi:RimJ/RimL family protein N-acetyltransferase
MIADPGTLLATTHELEDGTCVRLRLARPSDQPRVRGLLERLSPETRRERFIGDGQIDDALVRSFTFFDPRTRRVVAATVPAEGGEDLVGLADVDHLETGVAQLGVVVDDLHQGRGIGRLLAEAVASLALHRGASHLRAEMLAGNAPMLRVLERLGRVVRTAEDGREIVYVRISGRARRAA